MRARWSVISAALWLAVSAMAGHSYAQMAYPPPDMSSYATITAVPGLAPVQSVNAATGAVTVPTVCSQRTTPGSPLAVSSVDGTVTFTWPNSVCAFATLPNCFISLAQSSTLYVFSAPLQTTLDSTHVVFTTQAALKLLSISLGALTVWGPPPAGTTAAITCVAPPA